ncbi:MAG: S-layer homology domain-containing protein, partial [Acidimicrobiales bacterium]
MPTLGRPTARCLIALLVTSIVLVGPAVATPTAAGAQEPDSSTVIVTGHGWGHGRGLGQWGAFGYATGRSGGPWGYGTILGHFYGDTVAGNIGNPLAAVDLLGQRGLPLTAERAAGVTVDGVTGTSVAVRVTLRPDGRFDVERAQSCVGATWTEPVVVDGPVRLRAAGTSGAASDTLGLCTSDGTRIGYRGELVAFSQSFDGADVGLAQTVNLVRLDDLLRSVVPQQVPAAWAAVDGGRGRQAVLAQVVAARGFAAVGDPRWHDLHSGLGAQFTTCDSSACQPYEGVATEDPITDGTVAETTGEVRVRDGALVRTEFSASSGGWTAGGEFPPVPDVGDAVSDNPNHSWATSLDGAAIEARYELGNLLAIAVIEQNGLGADGGRALLLRMVGTAKTVEVTGASFRVALGLRSDWFTVTGIPPRPAVEPRDVDDACPVGAVPSAGFTDVELENVHRFPIECTTWWGVTNGVTPTTYRPASPVTRAQEAAMLARLIEQAGGRLPQNAADAFADDDGNLHEDAINALAALEVVRGTTEGRFEPGEPVTREQTATMVARALEELRVDLPEEPADAFADDTGSVHESAVNVLAAEGIATGVAAGYYQPRLSIQR